MFRCLWNSSALDSSSITNVLSTYLIHRRGWRVSKALASNCFMAASYTRLERNDPVDVPLIFSYAFPSKCRYVSKHRFTRFIMAFVDFIILSRRLASIAIKCRIPSSATSVGMSVNDDVTSVVIIISSIVQFEFLDLFEKGGGALSAGVVFSQERT